MCVACTSLVAQGVLPAPVVPFPGSCNTWYVDPVNGNNAGPGTLAQPWQTLTFAMATAGGFPGTDTLVLLPGIYGPLETFPIIMQPDVSIQGTSALDTVILQTGAASSALHFEPNQVNAYDSVVVDGVAILGARRCVEIQDGVVAGQNVRANPTIANCFLIDAAIAAVDIEIDDLAPPFPAHDTNGDGFVENRPKLINLTIITSGTGILNQFQSPGGSVPVILSEPGLLNVLLSNNGVDLNGIDAADVITCAFRSTINPIGAFPIPVFDTFLNPPQYIETNTGPAGTPFDLRLRPGSPAIDVGSQPPLVWMNGTTGQATFACTVDIFDTDCEGYGNLRVDRVAIDIGADESGQLIIAGYDRGTRNLTGSFASSSPGQMEIFSNPFPAFPPGGHSGVLLSNVFVPVPPGGFWQTWAPVTIQDVRSILSVPATATPFGTQLMNTTTVTRVIQFWASPLVAIVIPIGPGVPGPMTVQFNWQCWPFQPPLNGTLSNLQTNGQ